MTEETTGPPLSARLARLLNYTKRAADSVRADVDNGEPYQPKLETFMGEPTDGSNTYESIWWGINPDGVHPPDRAAAVLTTVLVSGPFEEVDFAVFSFEAWYKAMPKGTDHSSLQRGDLSRMADEGDPAVLTAAMSLGIDVKGENNPMIAVMLHQPIPGTDQVGWQEIINLPGQKTAMDGHVTDVMRKACMLPHTDIGLLMREKLGFKQRAQVVAFLMKQEMITHAAIATNRDDLLLDKEVMESQGLSAYDLLKGERPDV